MVATTDNQAPPLTGHDVFCTDAALAEGVARHDAGWAQPALSRLGRLAGSERAQEWGRLANTEGPRLLTTDRYGARIDEVEFHPAWHELMTVSVSEGLHGSHWAEPGPGAQVARAAGFFVWTQVEAGHLCPISMTSAAVPALRVDPEMAAVWEPRLTSRSYDFGLRDPATKAGCLAGMGMTERQGGSDVRTNTTTATPTADGSYLLNGHKWFTSAPMCDLFLMLAQAPGGLTCFAVPRVLPDGTRNPFRIARLKDKLGNRSNASSEPDLVDTVGWRLGDEGRGVRTIIEMVTMTRLDCVIGSAATMRGALAQALHHTAHRAAFGRTLVDQPLMQAVLADLAVESEAATALTLRLAAAVDAGETRLRRLGAAIGKYWVCKRTPATTAEALECLGGNGYVEDFPLARYYREAPLNSLWEGSGNVNALDVLRALRRDPETWDTLRDEIALAAGADSRLDAALADLEIAVAELATADPDAAERSARLLAERMALAWQGSLLVRHAPAAVADAFCGSRLTGSRTGAFGALGAGVDTAAIVRRAMPTEG